MFFCLKIEKNRNFKNSDENSRKTSYKISLSSWEIREQITPKGDGNVFGKNSKHLLNTN